MKSPAAHWVAPAAQARRRRQAGLPPSQWRTASRLGPDHVSSTLLSSTCRFLAGSITLRHEHHGNTALEANHLARIGYLEPVRIDSALPHDHLDQMLRDHVIGANVDHRLAELRL